MSLLFNYYFGSDMYNSGNGSTTLVDRFTTGRTARNATLKKNQGSSMTTRNSAISNNYATDSPYSSGIGNNTATNSFLPDPQGNDGNKCSFYEHQLSSSFENTSFTICTWVKMGTTSNTTDRDTFFASGVRGENNSTTFQLGIYKVDNSYYQLIINVNETDNNKYFEITPDNVDYRDNTNWQFVAVTYHYDSALANREIKTYIFSDSTTPDYTNTYTSTTGSGNKNKILSEYDFKFSTYRFGTNRQVQRYWTGSIAASRGYNYVLTQAQITNIYQYNSLDGSTNGDPHIKTLFGINYKFDYLGSFRMFDNNASDINKRILINGFSKYGEEKRWGNNQYVRMIYIFCGNKDILIDTGFRGEKVHVIESKGIDYEIEELTFDKDAKIHCFDCRKNFGINKFNSYSVQNHIKKTCHKVLPPIRNNLKIKLNIDNKVFSINISNVNKYNLQPCRIKIEPMNIIDNTFSGTLIHRKYAITCGINNIKDLTKIEEPNNVYLNLPSLETNPGKINKEFY